MQKNVVIIGAGPAGLLLAHYLLDRGGYRLNLYERRADPVLNPAVSDRSFPLAIQTRGLRALQGIEGLEAALAQHGIWSYGAYLHRKKGKPRRVDRQTPSLLIDRQQLIIVLTQQLLERFPGQVQLHYECACQGVDPATQTVTLQHREHDPFTVSFDYLVGADGARSQVREALAAAQHLHCEQDTIPDVYKSLRLQRISPDGAYQLESDRIHTWSAGVGTRLVMAPQVKDQLNGTLIFQPQANPLENIETPEALLDYFQDAFPRLAPLLTPEVAADLLAKPISKILTVKCDRLHVGAHILLIGDAVHAVSPSVGQGCNASLQDAMSFAQLLDHYQDDWGQALPGFTQQRLPEAHALRDLSDYSFPRSKPMLLEFIIRLLLGQTLGRWLPQLVKPLPMQLLMETEMPYSAVLAQTKGWVDRVRASMAQTP